MPKGSGRKERERLLAQYELVGFSAGMVKNSLTGALDMMDRREARHGSDAYMVQIERLLREAVEQIAQWQAAEQVRREYPEKYRRGDG